MVLKGRNKIVLILGRKGSGKTSLVRAIVPKLERVVVLDPLEEYHGLIRARDFNSLLSFLEAVHEHRKIRIACTFSTMEEYERAIYLVREVGNIWIIIEELNYFVDCWSHEEAYLDLIRFGRHDGVSILMVAQRAAEIPKLFTSQSDAIVSFKQTEPRDLDYLSKIGHIGEDGARTVAALPILQGIPANVTVLRAYYSVFYA